MALGSFSTSNLGSLHNTEITIDGPPSLLQGGLEPPTTGVGNDPSVRGIQVFESHIICVGDDVMNPEPSVLYPQRQILW